MVQFPFSKLKNEVRAHLTKANALPPKPSPDELLGELFADVQLRRVHPDSKTFVDLVPAEKLNKILKIYRKRRHNHDFDLQQFVARYFRDYLQEGEHAYTSKAALTAEQHIERLWDVLQRKVYSNRGSLMALPYPYLVPGGRYVEQFYWDSYFIMLGLAASGRYDQIEGIIKNYAHLIRKIGFIPTANRTYLLSRSQPPFFAHMVTLLAKKQGNAALIRYLPYMLQEYRFWMRGSRKVTHMSPSYRRVVLMPDGSILNRYYDSKSTPRPESYKEDVETAHAAPARVGSQVYLDLRAGAESGWDYSSRWLRDHKNLETIHTTDIVPVDLNCLLLDLENTIARVYRLLKQNTLAKRFENRAEVRAAAINKYCWSSERQFYFDYDFVIEKQTDVYSLAGVFPLYSGVADISQAMSVAGILKDKFLQPGGLTATLEETGQQWDSPNGWAPLQWVAIKSLRRYEVNELADDIKQRWIATNLAIYKAKSKLVEKYDVVDLGEVAGGGEYPLQDGFGWTNGVLLALLLDQDL